jgi:hypothetical protein
MKTIEDTKIETAYNYAFNYYKQHGRSLDHQNACINQMVGLTGFDRGTCIDIQNPVQSIMMYNETVELSHTIVQQQLNIVTGIIRDHLLNINHGNVEKNQSSDSSFKTPPVPYVSKTPAYTAQEMVGWLEHTNNTQNLKFNLPYKEINLSGKSVADEDMVFFAQRMSNFAFHLDNLQLNHNPIGDYGIQALFNCTFTVPLGRSVVHLKLNNCNFGDVGAELIAAYVRDGYMPATRAIDLHGNNVTKVGEEKLSFAVNNTPNESLAIVVEKHFNPSGVSNFFKKAFKYYTEAFAVKTKGNTEVAVGIYGHDDWNACKKLAVDFSREVTVGFVKHSEYKLVNLMLNKAPKKVKEATVGAVFVVASVEAALNVDVENLAYCLTAINANFFGDGMYDPNKPLSSAVFIGNDGEFIDEF